MKLDIEKIDSINFESDLKSKTQCTQPGYGKIKCFTHDIKFETQRKSILMILDNATILTIPHHLQNHHTPPHSLPLLFSSPAGSPGASLGSLWCFPHHF